MGGVKGHFYLSEFFISARVKILAFFFYIYIYKRALDYFIFFLVKVGFFLALSDQPNSTK